MSIPVRALPVSFAAHAVAVISTVMVLTWCISFRGGLAWDSLNKSLIFNIHPVLMLVGFVILGGEAIMSFKSLPLRKETKKVIHLSLHGAALVLGVIGICAAFKYHNESGIPNLYSLHSWLGITLIILYFIQWIYGFLVFFYPGGPATMRSVSLPWHVLFGLTVYVLVLCNALIGFLEKLTFLENSGLAKYGTEALLVNFTAVISIIYGGLVVFTALSHAQVTDEYHHYSAI